MSLLLRLDVNTDAVESATAAALILARRAAVVGNIFSSLPTDGFDVAASPDFPSDLVRRFAKDAVPVTHEDVAMANFIRRALVALAHSIRWRALIDAELRASILAHKLKSIKLMRLAAVLTVHPHALRLIAITVRLIFATVATMNSTDFDNIKLHDLENYMPEDSVFATAQTRYEALFKALTVVDAIALDAVKVRLGGGVVRILYIIGGKWAYADLSAPVQAVVIQEAGGAAGGAPAPVYLFRQRVLKDGEGGIEVDPADVEEGEEEEEVGEEDEDLGVDGAEGDAAAAAIPMSTGTALSLRRSYTRVGRGGRGGSMLRSYLGITAPKKGKLGNRHRQHGKKFSSPTLAAVATVTKPAHMRLLCVMPPGESWAGSEGQMESILQLLLMIVPGNKGMMGSSVSAYGGR